MNKLFSPGRVSLWIVLLLVSVGIPAAWAHPPHSLVTRCVIVETDAATRLITFKEVPGGNSMAMVWNSDTKFECDDKEVAGAELKPGTEATVKYRRPFFGKPVVVSVAWRS